MGISAETLRIWGEIELKVVRKIRSRMSDKVAAEDVFSEVKVLFLTRDFPYKHTPQAYSYAVNFLYKQALGAEGITLNRICISETGTTVLQELGAKPIRIREEIENVEDLYHPQATFISYDLLQEEGWEQAAAEFNPLNPTGFNERTSAYLANPRIAPEAKAMALQILAGDTFAEVAERHGCSVQTINRRLRQDLEELDPELLYVVKNVRKKPKKAAKVVSSIAIVESIAAEAAWEETIELALTSPAEIEAQAPGAKVVTISEYRKTDRETVTGERFTTKIPAIKVVHPTVWPGRLAARPIPPHQAPGYHTYLSWRRIWPETPRCGPWPAICAAVERICCRHAA